jgi:hypothetical protein
LSGKSTGIRRLLLFFQYSKWKIKAPFLALLQPLRRTASSDVHGEMVEKKLVLKLEADEVDKEKLEAVFGRSATYQMSFGIEKQDPWTSLTAGFDGFSFELELKVHGVDRRRLETVRGRESTYQLKCEMRHSNVLESPTRVDWIVVCRRSRLMKWTRHSPIVFGRRSIYQSNFK